MTKWMAHRPHWLLMMAGVFLLGAGWIVWSANPEQAAASGRIASPHPGFAAPDFDLETLGGDRLRLSDLQGQVVVVNLWATWCPPCRAEMPALQQLYEAHRDEGLVVVAVNATDQDSATAARTFVADHGLTFPVALDTRGEASRAYALQAMPSTFVVDRQGVIREVLIGGPVSLATLRSVVTPLLEEAD
jgi:cytochrome c biogenesis protein CcmG, thiol:disulfide interchange protein DsbE